jgi:putative ABC transport system substrate-binding protein
MRRREFIALGCGAAAWPLAALAQQSAMPVVGFLNSGSPVESRNLLAAFRQGLKDAGYVESQNLAIEYRWAEGRYDRLPALASDLASRPVALIAAGGPPAALAAKSATTTIPIVFTSGTDPVALGLVARLNRPGGNITGMSILNVELAPKRLELLRELVPSAQTLAALINPTYSTAAAQTKDMKVAAELLGLRLHVPHGSTEQDIDSAFASLAGLQIAGLAIGNDPFLNNQHQRIATLALRHAVPVISQYREFVAAGGLMSYGGSITDVYYKAGTYAGRVLKGEKPSDLPVQQSTKIELIINMKTAKTLGLTFPITLLGRADEVIE